MTKTQNGSAPGSNVCNAPPGRPDPVSVVAALGYRGRARITAAQGGADAAIWRVQHDAGDFALRLLRPDQAATAQREAAALAASGAAGVPVPHVHAMASHEDHPALLISWMPGRPLWQELAHRPWTAWTLGVRFGRIQAAIHAVPIPKVVAQHPRHWIDWGHPDPALRARLYAVTREHEALLHLDYHAANVLVDRGQISAVLDWANVHTGDRRADLARTATILHFTPLVPVSPSVAACVRRAFVAGWRAGYRQRAGATTGMAPFYAWAAVLMLNELTPRLGRSDLPWLTRALLSDIRLWGDRWYEAAGL